MGVATASTQIEGGVVDNNWNKSFLEGLIKDNSNPARADDHYNRYHEDTHLMKEMGLEISNNSKLGYGSLLYFSKLYKSKYYYSTSFSYKYARHF